MLRITRFFPYDADSEARKAICSSLHAPVLQHTAWLGQPCRQEGVNPPSPISETLLLRVVEQLRALGQVVRLRLIERLARGQATPQKLADELGSLNKTSRSISRFSTGL